MVILIPIDIEILSAIFSKTNFKQILKPKVIETATNINLF